MLVDTLFVLIKKQAKVGGGVGKGQRMKHFCLATFDLVPSMI